jgi:hypothetical protein
MTCGQWADWTTKWLTAIGTAGAVVVALVIALFQEKLRRWYYHPTLEVSASPKLPDCTKLPYVQVPHVSFSESNQPIMVPRRETTSYYLRILVKNNGRETARNVEVYAKKLVRHRKSDSQWEKDARFPPMNLVWSNSEPDQRNYLRFLPPGMSKHCDVGHILDPKDRKDFEADDNPELKLADNEVSLTFDLIQRSLHKGYIVRQGEYRLEIVIAADNVDAVTKDVRIYFDGQWDAVQDTMLRDHVGIGLEPVTA